VSGYAMIVCSGSAVVARSVRVPSDEGVVVKGIVGVMTLHS
jgi:hypothetical protein